MTQDSTKHVWLNNYPDGVDWNADIAPVSLPAFFADRAKRYAERPFLNFLGKEYTYGESMDVIEKLSTGLQAMGVKKGVHVGLFLPNTPYTVWFYYAVLRAGGTVVNYNPLYTEKELHHQIEDSETDIMITADLKLLCDKVVNLLESTRLKTLVVCPFTEILPFPKSLLFKLFKGKELAKLDMDDDRIVSFDHVRSTNHTYQAPQIDPVNDVAVLQYTGGTTGRPKGAMLTHENIYANAAQVGLWVGPLIDPNRQLSMVGVLPFFHVFAMTAIMNMSIYQGMRILLQPNFELKRVLKLVDKEKPDLFAGVPAIYNAMAKHDKIDHYDFSSLKYCISGGAPLPKEVKNRFTEKTGCKWLSEGYGLTESSPVATCNPVRGDIRIGTIGLPLPQTVIEIVDAEDKTTLMPFGEKGEVCIRGPQVMKGYYNQQDETDNVLKGGRLHTGDIGIMDADGYVTLVDRIKDLILVRGYNVYPTQVEDEIYKHKDVEECIVAGVPDEERGETVWAWVKPRAGRKINADELKEFLKPLMSPIELPRKIIIRDQELPKTPVGKLSRKMLLEQEGIKRA